MFKRFLKIPLLIFAFTLGLNMLWKFMPSAFELIYQKVIFTAIRYLYDYLIGSWLPIPMLWLSLSAIIYVVFVRRYKHKNMKSLLTQILGHVFIVFSLFYILWGWNYSQISVAEKINISASAVDSTQLMLEFDWLVEELNDSRSKLSNSDSTLRSRIMTRQAIEMEVRHNLSRALESINYPTPGRPRVRVLKPKGLLLRFKTAGIYMPYAFEGHIDGGLLELEWPYTIAHEMSHAYGVTDEGECNFTAFLACVSSNNPYLQYSALVDYTLYILRDIYKLDPSLHALAKERLPKGFLNDLKAMRENNDMYPDILPALRDLMYDSYLKSNGVQSGLASYSQLTNLVIQFKMKNPNFFPSKNEQF